MLTRNEINAIRAGEVVGKLQLPACDEVHTADKETEEVPAVKRNTRYDVHPTMDARNILRINTKNAQISSSLNDPKRMKALTKR